MVTAVIAGAGLLLTGCVGPPLVEASGPATDAATRSVPTASGSASASEPASTAPQAQPRYLPAVGECLDSRKDRAAGPDSVVPCAEPHDDEVYATFELAPGGFPGADTAQQQADDGCRARFADFVGVPADASMFGWYSFAPDEPGWAIGDRRVACALWHPTDLVTGSLRGIAY